MSAYVRAKQVRGVFEPSALYDYESFIAETPAAICCHTMNLDSVRPWVPEHGGFTLAWRSGFC
jgi:hypothetical protein